MTCWRSRRESSISNRPWVPKPALLISKWTMESALINLRLNEVGRGFQGHVSNDQLNLDSIDEVLGQCAQAIARTADHYELHTPAG
jgi:hypothetical protein